MFLILYNLTISDGRWSFCLETFDQMEFSCTPQLIDLKLF